MAAAAVALPLVPGDCRRYAVNLRGAIWRGSRAPTRGRRLLAMWHGAKGRKPKPAAALALRSEVLGAGIERSPGLASGPSLPPRLKATAGVLTKLRARRGLVATWRPAVGRRRRRCWRGRGRRVPTLGAAAARGAEEAREDATWLRRLLQRLDALAQRDQLRVLRLVLLL